MIITRTPFRISFFGGGTDYPIWYRENDGGAVLSTTFNKYCYISCRFLPPFFEYKYLIRYRLREERQHISEINHPSVRECLKFSGIERGVEIVHTSDIPARSGVGSSSAFTVGLLNSLNALKGKMTTKRQLSRDAIYVEQQLIKENVGSQDQVAVSFGGFNKIEFGGDNEFFVSPVTISKEKEDLLQSRLMLFFTGFSRNSSDITGEQIKQTPHKKAELQTMKHMVDQALGLLNRDGGDIDDFGRLLHESWKLKRSLSPLISNQEIDAVYQTARKAGAHGGKLLGGGGGGFILFFAPPECHQKIKEKLRKLPYVPFGFEKLGTQIVLYSTQDHY